MISPERARTVVSLGLLDESDAGFALPILGLVDPVGFHALAIQIVDELTGRVHRFAALDDVPERIVPYDGVVSVACGQEAIFGFVSAGNKPLVGTLRQLESHLRSFTERAPANVSVGLQIAALIGSGPEKRVARSRMRRSIAESSGTAAAEAFLLSNLQEVLWEKLISSAPDEAAARKILCHRPRMKAEFLEDRRIDIDISCLDPADYGQKKASDLIEEIRIDLDDVVGLAASDRVELEAERNLKEQVIRALRTIRRFGRQEERVALMLSAVLARPLIAERLVSAYGRDKGDFANWAFKELVPMAVKPDQSSLAEIVQKLYTHCHPMARGVMLSALAKHLSHNPTINAEVRKKIERSRSFYVMSAREDMLADLDQNVFEFVSESGPSVRGSQFGDAFFDV